MNYKDKIFDTILCDIIHNVISFATVDFYYYEIKTKVMQYWKTAVIIYRECVFWQNTVVAVWC